MQNLSPPPFSPLPLKKKKKKKKEKFSVPRINLQLAQSIILCAWQFEASATPPPSKWLIIRLMINAPCVVITY